ncbi:hypothetical protein [Paenibacillus sp. S-12]|uniref:hypothetical protein n=1 Tax=Paenibacillus sp. S-12 TaxID=3031371 RepID=UPI0025A016CE|nr:hypothetical protein [Paenibacillus sp. S-12]
MTNEHLIASREFEAPFVRVRGRLSRNDDVRWSPCIRTYRQPQGLQFPDPVEHVDTIKTTNWTHDYWILFEDGQGNVLARALAQPDFFAEDQEWGTFVQRLPYHRQTARVVLRKGSKEIGVLNVTQRLPDFVLYHPIKTSDIDPLGILHLRWEEKSGHNKKTPYTYYVRFSHDHEHWVRPGVNLRKTEFDLDLRQMPGGKHCVAQVIATNGYQTAYVETRPFELPYKPAEILLGDTSGPLLFAQGFSRQHGPIQGENITWLMDGKKIVGMGSTFDVRKLRSIHRLLVRVQEPSGDIVSMDLGLYDGDTGLIVRPRAGF